MHQYRNLPPCSGAPDPARHSHGGHIVFIFSWNDFKMALILSNSQTRTLPVAVFNFVHEASLEWGPMMAYATIITLPVMLLTLVIQRHIVSGLTMGGVKA